VALCVERHDEVSALLFTVYGLPPYRVHGRYGFSDRRRVGHRSHVSHLREACNGPSAAQIKKEE